MTSSESITQSIQYIEQHLREGLTIEQLASVAGFSPYYFCRLFALHTGTPVMEYIRRRRLAYAVSELCEGKRILDVAMDWGFESHTGFAKAFRKVYGFSPDEFRRRVAPHRPGPPNPLSRLTPEEPTFCIHAFPMPFSSWKTYYTQGVEMVVSPIPHIPPQCVSPRGKHRNRLHMRVGSNIVSSTGGKGMALFMDQFGNLTETGGSNFVIYKDGVVYSPRRRNILWGISLQTVKEIVEEMGIPFVEEDIMIYDAVNADEAWVTTTPYCLAPVSKFNGQILGDGTFPMFRKVLDAWSKRVGKDLWDEIVNSEPIRYR